MSEKVLIMDEQITSQERHLHVAAADAAPGFPALVYDIAKQFSIADPSSGSPLAESIVMNEYNSDWDPLYPFSSVGVVPPSLVI